MEQKVNKTLIINHDDRHRREQMAQELKDVITRSKATLLTDAIGAVAVFVTLGAGLYLPGLI